MSAPGTAARPHAPASTVVDALFRLPPAVVIGGAFMLLLIAVAVLAPALATMDPTQISPALRNRPPGAVLTFRDDTGALLSRVAVMGTDSLGRDVYSRMVYGARISLMVGFAVALTSTVFGVLIGLVAGYFRRLDGPVMRLMDGLMAIPGVLLAIALVALLKAGLFSVIIAIIVPEIPRVVRVVRSYVLSIREEPYVEAAITVGTPTHLLLARHILPNLLPPLIVQSTFICASAILVEAYLSFLGIGLPPETPTWGNLMAEGRTLFRVAPHIIFAPGALLAVTILALNSMGDGLRDMLDPKTARQR